MVKLGNVAPGGMWEAAKLQRLQPEESAATHSVLQLVQLEKEQRGPLYKVMQERPLKAATGREEVRASGLSGGSLEVCPGLTDPMRMAMGPRSRQGRPGPLFRTPTASEMGGP